MRSNNGLVVKNIYTKNGRVYASLCKFDVCIISATIDYISDQLYDENRSSLFEVHLPSQKSETG